MEVLLSLLPLLVLLGVVYVFAVLPRRRKMAKQAALVEGLQPNDVVNTSAGIRGRVVGWKGPLVTVEVAPGVTFNIDPAKIESVTEQAAEESASEGETTHCAECGASIGPSDQFCGECGAPSR